MSCPPDKIINPKTNRCVKKTGRIGRSLLPKSSKNCPKDKVVNPKTNRCVKETSRIGRKLSPVRYVEDKKKSCPEDKILNPRTKRCVKKDGRVGKELLKKMKVSYQLPEESEEELETVMSEEESDIKEEPEVKVTRRKSKSPSPSPEPESEEESEEEYIEPDLTDLLEEPGDDPMLGELLEQNVLMPDSEEEVEEEPEIKQPKGKKFESGSVEFYYYAMKYLNSKYKQCFLKPQIVIESKRNKATGLFPSGNEYELIWEDKPEKRTVIQDAKDTNYKLYGNRYKYFVDDKYRPGTKEIDGLLYVNKKVTQKIMECMKGKDRFIILSVTVNKIETRGKQVGVGTPHANILLYDKKNNTLERYEPHGPAYNITGKKSQKLMDIDIAEYFMDIGLIKSRDDYYEPLRFCPKWDKWQEGRVGHQMLQNLQSKEFVGSCATWCMWYINERLDNPDRPRDQVIQESIEEMQSSSKGFTKFIKKYFEIIKNYRDKN
jgi:hypothetical protein